MEKTDIYTTKEEIISIKNLARFDETVTNRILRPLAIERIAKGIEKSLSVEGSIAVNEREEGKWRIIDGNHRYAAIKIYLNKFPNAAVRATFHIYKELTDDEEKIVYVKCNATTTQNKEDFIKRLCYDTFIYRSLIEKEKHFPFQVELKQPKKLDTIGFVYLIEPYILSHLKNGNKSSHQSKSFGNVNTKDLVIILAKLNEDDFKQLKQFAEDYIEIFGKPNPNIVSSRHVFLYVFQRLYWSARECMTPNDFKKRLKKNYQKYQPEIKQHLDTFRGNSDDSRKMLYYLMLKCVNYGIHGSDMRIRNMLEG